MSKGLQLPQVQHGLNHHLQRAHAMRPAPPRALRGVRSDLADDSVLKKDVQERNKLTQQTDCDFYCKRHE